MVEPKACEAAVCEGAYELRGEGGTQRTFINTTSAEDDRWRPLLVDEDRQAVCQAMKKGNDGEECERLFYKYAETHQAVNIRKPGNSHNAKAQRMLRDAKTKEEVYHDWSDKLWEAHVQSPTAALEEALRRTEAGSGQDPVLRTPTVAAFTLSPEDGLEQEGEGCDGRPVQASSSDANGLEC